MNILERYVARRLLASLTLVLVVLLATVWLSQAVRQFDLITNRGQAFLTFFHLTLLILPQLLAVIAPVAMAIATVYTLTTLNNGSELAIVSGSGGSPVLILKPLLLVSLGLTLLLAGITLSVAPTNQRALRDLVTKINADILTSVIRDGRFIQLADGLTIHVKRRLTDGTLDGIFVSDGREAGQNVIYAARRGAVIDNPIGSFLVMQDGVIQRQQESDGSISMIEFRAYAFDLSTFTGGGETTTYKPGERSTGFLLNPDLADPLYQQFPNRFRSELHQRITAPLFGLVFALIPMAFFGEASTARQRRTAKIAGLIVALAVARELHFVAGSLVEARPGMVPLLYAVPIGAILFSLATVFGYFSVPQPVVRMIDNVSLGLRARLRRPEPAGVAGQ